MSPRPARRLLLALCGASLLAGGFAWGFMSGWRKIVPFALLRRAATAMGFHRPGAPEPAGNGGRFSNLRSLPYISGSYDPARDRRGVILHKPEKCFAGYNLYSSGFGHCSALVDMRGRVLWRWCAEQALGKKLDPRGWINLAVSPEGDVLLNVQESGIYRIDAHSRPVRLFSGRTHHDLFAGRDGRIFAPEHRVRPGAPTYDEEILDDAVTVLDPKGGLLQQISLLDLFTGSPYAFLLPRVRNGGYRAPEGLEPFHLNHVEVFDGRLSSVSPLFRAGNLLLSMRHVSCVAIVDSREKRILWAWGPGNVLFQHDPTLLPNGHVLIFDNGLEKSEIVEVDPVTDRVVWTYAPAKDFFSPQLGAAQRLENGNTLVTESDRGYAFEVTPSGEQVWRFANPDIDAAGFRSGILRMTRFPESDLPFLMAHLPDPKRKP